MKETISALFNQENEFFKLTDGAKRITHIAFSSLLLPVVFLALAGFLTQFVLAPLFFTYIAETTTFARQAFGLYVMFGSFSAMIFLWVKFYEGRPVYTLGFTSNNAVKKYLFGFGTGAGLNIIVVGIMALFGSIEMDYSETALTGFDAVGGVIIMLFGFVVQGASEEILARGWMFQVIGARYKPWIGALITSIFFSVLHLGNDGVNAFAVINLVFFAVLMVIYVMKDGSLWAACGWHSAWNWTMGNVLGLSVSGTEDKACLINLGTTGNELISGGGFGPEGSMITSVVLLISIIYFANKVIRKSK